MSAANSSERTDPLSHNVRSHEVTLAPGDEKFAVIFHASPIAMSLASLPDAAVYEVNQAWLDLLGFERHEVLGKTSTELGTIADPEGRLKLFDEFRRQGFVRNAEIAALTKQGARRMIRVYLRRVEIGGRPFILSSNEDITDRKKAEAALLESERRLAAELSGALRLQDLSTQLIKGGNTQSLFHQLLDTAIAITRADFGSIQRAAYDDGDSIVLHLLAQRGFHERSERHWGRVSLHATTTCGIALKSGARFSIYDVEQWDLVKGTADLEEYRRSGIAAMQSTPLISRAGRLLGVISTHWRVPYQPSENELRLVDVLARQAADLIDRTTAEEALQRQEVLLTTALTAARMIAWEWDPVADKISVSANLAEIYGLPREATIDNIGQAFSLVHPDDVARHRSIVMKAVAERGSYLSQFRIIRPIDDSVIWLEERAQVVCDVANEKFRLCGIVMDITDRKHAEDALRDADRRKDEFLATLAHELRNPLAPIRNAASVLKLKGLPDPESAWCRNVIDRHSQHMARLLDDLLDVSRISHGKLELRRESAELAAIVQETAEAIHPLLNGADRKLTIEIPSMPIYLDVDRVRMVQVLTNVLGNAVKYTDSGGQIHLSATREAKDVVISVLDDGIGIEPEALPRLFEIFSQTQLAMERSQGGLGIGLSLVRGVIELHGGTVEARSDGPGKGSEFIIRLPSAVRLRASEPFVATPLQQSVRSRRVLVVDDSKDSADSLAKLLDAMGHETRAVYDGEQAISAVEEFSPEVVLLDIGMPKLNGYDVCRRIRQRSNGDSICLIALTGWGGEDHRLHAAEAGFDRHVVKPVDAGAILGILTSLP